MSLEVVPCFDVWSVLYTFKNAGRINKLLSTSGESRVDCTVQLPTFSLSRTVAITKPFNFC